MHEDGNLILHDSLMVPIWTSGTGGKSAGPFKVVMQNDDNLVLYDKNNKPLWSSNPLKLFASLSPFGSAFAASVPFRSALATTSQTGAQRSLDPRSFFPFGLNIR